MSPIGNKNEIDMSPTFPTKPMSDSDLKADMRPTFGLISVSDSPNSFSRVGHESDTKATPRACARGYFVRNIIMRERRACARRAPLAPDQVA